MRRCASIRTQDRSRCKFWDSSADLPLADGTPADQDIPCNLLSLLKVREGKLEWLQVIRSNDLFLGVPHNFVQFTCLQEIMAGWLDLDPGPYHQISDSLHIYERDEANVLASHALDETPPNTDSLKLPRTESESAFRELARRIDEMIQPGLTRPGLKQLSLWVEGPQAFRNMLLVLVAERARRRGWVGFGRGRFVALLQPVVSRTVESMAPTRRR